MKKRKPVLSLRALMTATLIIAMLAISGGVVNASANHSSPSDTITVEAERGTITLESHRVAGRLYANATPVEYTDSFRTEITSDSIALMIYDSLYQHSVTTPDNDDYTLTVDPPFVSGDGTDFYKTQADLRQSFILGNIAFMYDHPEAFWVDLCGYTLTASSSDGVCAVTSITVQKAEYYTGAFSQRATVAQGINTAVSAIAEGSTRYDTLKNIHDYICAKAEYDYDEAKNGNTPEAHTAAPLFNGTEKFVCEGYAKSFKVLCDRFDIPCVLVCGEGKTDTGSEGHMWNYVKMDDGKWYAVDVTWDDQSSGTIHNYFLKGSNTVNSDHTPGKPGVINSDGTQGSVDIFYPGLSETDYDPSQATTTTSADGTTTTSADGTTTTSADGTTTTSADGTTTTSADGTTTTSADGTTTTSAEETTTTSADVTTTTTTQVNRIAIKLDNPDNGFVKSAEIPETAKAKAGNDDVELSKIKIIVSKLDNTKKKTMSDGIRKINSGFDPDNSILEVYDIELVDDRGNTVTITEGKVTLCLTFSGTQTKKYTNYVYSLYHQKAEGGVERVKGITVNAQGVWFDGDKFSPFGLVSVEKSGGEEPSPGTGETILMTVVALILLALAACAIAFVVIRNMKSSGADSAEDNGSEESGAEENKPGKE